MPLMGIDVGSTNMKCVVIADDGQLLSLVKIPSVLISQTPDGKSYIDGDILLDAVIKMSEEAYIDSGINKLDGVAIAGVGCAPVIIDVNGKQIQIQEPENNIFSDPLPELTNEDFRQLCGYSKEYSLGVYAILKHFTDIDESISLMSISDYLNFRLTGVRKRDRSTAGSFALLNRKTKEYLTDMFTQFNVNSNFLPELCDSGDFLGEFKISSFYSLLNGTPIFAGGHDYLCAAFAAGCVGTGDMVNVLGTYEMLASFYEHPVYAPDESDFYTFMDQHVFPGRFTVTAELHSNYTIDPDSKNSSKMYDYQLRLIEDIKKLRVMIVGGGSVDINRVQKRADESGLILHVPAISEATATGAALLAGVGCGIYTSHTQAAYVYENIETKTYYPDRLTSEPL